MSEWWTYRLEDFLMFAPGTYQRMFALYNAQVWPAQCVALPLGALVLWQMARRPRAWRLACGVVAVGWAFTAWAFHAQRYAGIHTAAPWFAGAFAVQALLLGWMAWPGSGWQARSGPAWVRGAGLGLLAFALLLQPWLGGLLGRPWQQVALFGLTPDPTVVGTLGLLLLVVRGRGAAVGALPWAVPLLWCAVGSATLWTMAMPEWWLTAAAALLAACAAAAAARARPATPR